VPQNVRSYRGAVASIDHYLAVAEMKMQVTGIKPRRKTFNHVTLKS